jgi:8-oxo-dGTP pyrophosphatase MutT (NUDIX family)
MVETEKSSGFIVFRVEKGIRKYLLLYKPASGIYRESWGFPKGWAEKGENDLATARRETEEEAGIKDLEVIPGFKETVKFFFKKDGKMIAKTVVWFLGETKQVKAEVSWEHKEADWFVYDEALTKLTFKTDKDVLKTAEEFLKKPRSDLSKFVK